MDKQIAHNKITKFNAISDIYILSLLRFKLKPNGGWQQIHHLTYSQGSSVNYYIIRNFGALEYINIDDVITVLLILSKEIIIVKRNLLDTFCHVYIAMNNKWLFGFFGITPIGFIDFYFLDFL